MTARRMPAALAYDRDLAARLPRDDREAAALAPLLRDGAATLAGLTVALGWAPVQVGYWLALNEQRGRVEQGADGRWTATRGARDLARRCRP